MIWCKMFVSNIMKICLKGNIRCPCASICWSVAAEVTRYLTLSLPFSLFLVCVDLAQVTWYKYHQWRPEKSESCPWPVYYSDGRALWDWKLYFQRPPAVSPCVEHADVWDIVGCFDLYLREQQWCLEEDDPGNTVRFRASVSYLYAIMKTLPVFW